MLGPGADSTSDTSDGRDDARPIDESESGADEIDSSEDESGSGQGESDTEVADESDESDESPPIETDGELPERTCDKVDFLFVIDNSISMLPEQTALSVAFPGFIAAIEGSLDTDDHILVTDTDALGWCTPSACASPGLLHPTCEGPGSFACTGEFDTCDVTLGAGVVRPAGQGSSNTDCKPFGGQRFIIDDEPDKQGVFDCMAHVGLAGSPQERPLDAIVAALGPTLTARGGCNESFLRDDAILVVTFISDDDGHEDSQLPTEAYAKLVAAKGGDADRIVVLGLIPDPDAGCIFTPGAGEHWGEFIELFGDRGLRAPVCEQNYVGFFQAAVDLIVEACTDNPV